MFLLGDYNMNGIVDAGDFPVWADSVGDLVNPYEGADGSGNGVIDQADWDIWNMNFGKTAGSVPFSQAVPEPTAGCVLLVGMCYLIRRRRISGTVR